MQNIHKVFIGPNSVAGRLHCPISSSELKSHIPHARGSRHTVEMEDSKVKQEWRQQLQKKYGGTIREDAAPQAESMQHEAAVVINEFGDTIDPALLRELEESENASDVSGDQEPEDVSIEDIFNIDRDQISGQQIDNDLLDVGWDVDDLEDEDEDADGWEVASELPSDVEGLASSNKSSNMRKEEIQDRWKQSAALQSLPKDVLKKLQEYQEEADILEKELKKKRRGVGQSEQKTHKQLRLISGSLAGRKLLSGTGELTRPMMEKVRSAAFDMLLSRCGSMAGLPEGSSWLDLFAGTGSVGLEAMSRGVESCHFIEMDKWVVDKVLAPNLQSCKVKEQCLVHTMRAEDYLQRAVEAPEYAQSFDFISVCPPYLKVSYPELFSLLAESPLIHDESHIIVEYPRKEKSNIPDRIGPLSLVKDRKFGRTFLAIYGPE